jgi:hypothetical protein
MRLHALSLTGNTMYALSLHIARNSRKRLDLRWQLIHTNNVETSE